MAEDTAPAALFRFAPVTSDEYYHATLKNAGIEPKPAEDIPLEKIAEQRQVSLEVAKLAEDIFIRLGKDGVKYASAAERAEDALEIAKGYVAHRDAQIKQAEEAAASLAVEILAAAASLAEKTGGALTAQDVVKVAYCQVLEWEKHAANSLVDADLVAPATTSSAAAPAGVPAGAALPASPAGAAAAAVVPAPSGGWDHSHFLVGGNPSDINAGAIVKKMREEHGLPESHYPGIENHPEALLQYAKDRQLGQTHAQALAKMHASTQTKLPWGKMLAIGLPAAAAGAGAAYLLSRRSGKEKAEEEQRQLAVLRSRM